MRSPRWTGAHGKVSPPVGRVAAPVAWPLALCLLTLGGPVVSGSAGCGEPPTGQGDDAGTDAPPPDAEACDRGGDFAVRALRINEVQSDNDGVWVDELGETDDWIELVNAGEESLDLADYSVGDRSHDPAPLPSRVLAPGHRVLLWADAQLEQGELHLPFGLDSDGDVVELVHRQCGAVDRVELPALAMNDTFARLPDAAGAFAHCAYGTPARSNGDQCAPPAPPSLTDDEVFEPYTWAPGWPAAPTQLRITELALRPTGSDARFVEVLNAGDATVNLAEYLLSVAAFAPGEPYPNAATGTLLSWPVSSLAPGARVVVPAEAEAAHPLDNSDEFEGTVTLFGPGSAVLDRIDFMRWPEGAVLARAPETAAAARFHASASPGAANAGADPVPLRDVGDRLHHIRSEADFTALTLGDTEVGQAPVKFVIDMDAGDTVHFLSAERWALHYTFIRERIEHQTPLDRCDADEAAAFNQGWYEFSEKNYFQVEGRRYLLGTLILHANGLRTVEFAAGDTISPEQMRRAFFAAVERTPTPQAWFLRPVDASQLARMREIEGEVPVVGPNAPFTEVTYQPLSQRAGYGVLTFVPAVELQGAGLGPHSLVITDGVPNDLPFVGGLITEAFQTPLAHINVLSRARGTPNMALTDARNHPRLAPLLGKLVRLDVGAADFTVREASPEEAEAFWEAQHPSGPRVVPPSNPSVRGIQPLEARRFADAPAIGTKAAQFAELYRVAVPFSDCDADTVPLRVPERGFAVPVAHYLDHLRASGANDLLAELEADPAFRTDPSARAEGLEALRSLMLAAPVDPELLAAVESAIGERFGAARVRLRSSSNTEDLPEFNGAGLHTSVSAEVGSTKLSVEDGLRTVWASLWNLRAYDEREFANIEQSRAAMGVLVHLAMPGEAAQGVAISRNMLDVTRNGIYTINAQIGEASVTNPAPGVVTEQLLYTWPPRSPRVSYQTRSSLTGGADVLSDTDIRAVACALGAVHKHFRPLLDPARTNRRFAMQIEFKLDRGSRAVTVKQARPQPIPVFGLPTDCREY